MFSVPRSHFCRITYHVESLDESPTRYRDLTGKESNTFSGQAMNISTLIISTSELGGTLSRLEQLPLNKLWDASPHYISPSLAVSRRHNRGCSHHEECIESKDLELVKRFYRDAPVTAGGRDQEKRHDWSLLWEVEIFPGNNEVVWEAEKRISRDGMPLFPKIVSLKIWYAT